MTVKEFKEALVNVPDDAEVCLDCALVVKRLSNNIEYDEVCNRLIVDYEPTNHPHHQ